MSRLHGFDKAKFMRKQKHKKKCHPMKRAALTHCHIGIIVSIFNLFLPYAFYLPDIQFDMGFDLGWKMEESYFELTMMMTAASITSYRCFFDADRRRR